MKGCFVFGFRFEVWSLYKYWLQENGEAWGTVGVVCLEGEVQ